jgi:hypothetical protein
MFEALTGRKAIEGSSRTSLLGRIINDDPQPVTTIKAVTPYSQWLTIERVLRREPSARTQTAYELLNDLRGVQRDVEAGTVLAEANAVSSSGQMPIPFWRQRTAIVALILTRALGDSSTWLLKPTPTPVLRKVQPPLSDIENPWSWSAALSPDGTMIAFVAENQVWIRPLYKIESRNIPDTEDQLSLISPEFR